MGEKQATQVNFEEAVFDDLVYGDLEYKEVPTSRISFFLVASLSFLVTAVVLGQVIFLIFSKKQFYEARASANVSREIKLPTYRAIITDRFGEILAKNKSSFSVFLNSSVVSSSREFNSVIHDLSEILNTESRQLINLVEGADLEQNNWIPIQRNITSSEAITIKGLNRKYLQVVDDYEREYIDGPVFAHLIGYTGVGDENDIVGKSGLEREYDQRLRSKDGLYVFYKDALGELLYKKAISEPEPSPAVITTIDAGLQRYFYRRLQQGLQSLGRNSGAGIALNPKNGEILALVSLPSFDINTFVDGAKSEQRIDILNNDLKPLFNRAVSGTYSPGSTVKPALTLAALAEGVVQPESRIFSKGFIEIPNPYYPELPSKFFDWRAHGWVDSASALARSSNIYFYLVGGGLPGSVPFWEITQGYFNSNGLGIDKLRKYWKKIGFGEKTGIDLPFEASGFLPSAEEKQARLSDSWRLGDTYNVSIGQGDLMTTPIQLLNFIASIGNGGRIYRPFINKESSQDILIDYSDMKEEIERVKTGLEDTVKKSYGTAFSLAGLPITVAGKTGTPQTGARKRLNAFFAGYAPADGPEIAVLVLVEDAIDGSLNALPIAHDVFQWYYWNRIVKSE